MKGSNWSYWACTAGRIFSSACPCLHWSASFSATLTHSPLWAGLLHSRHPVFWVLQVVSRDDAWCAHSADYPWTEEWVNERYSYLSNTPVTHILIWSEKGGKMCALLTIHRLQYVMPLSIRRGQGRLENTRTLHNLCHNHPSFHHELQHQPVNNHKCPLATNSSLCSLLHTFLASITLSLMTVCLGH